MSVPPSTSDSSTVPRSRPVPAARRTERGAPRRRGGLAVSLAFVGWCFVVGTLLMYAPWMPAWARWTAAFTDPRVQAVVGHPTFRGAVTGFGLFHLVWGTHDLDVLIAAFLRRRDRRRRDEAAEAAELQGERAGEP